MNNWIIMAIGGAVIWLAIIGMACIVIIVVTAIKKIKTNSKGSDFQDVLRQAMVTGVRNGLKKQTPTGRAPRGPVAS